MAHRACGEHGVCGGIFERLSDGDTFSQNLFSTAHSAIVCRSGFGAAYGLLVLPLPVSLCYSDSYFLECCGGAPLHQPFRFCFCTARPSHVHAALVPSRAFTNGRLPTAFPPSFRILRAAPAGLSPGAAAAALEEAAEALAASRTPDIASARAELLKTVACKAAIKAGPSSEPEELQRLAEAVCSGRVRNCPHGRPVAWVLTRKELDRQFKRIL